MLRLGYIVDNYGQINDGVGAYAKVIDQNLPSWIQTTVYSSFCSPLSKRRRIFSLGMTKQLFRACRDAQKDRFDIILLEYPFAEWQPLIILPILLLHGIIKGKKKLVLSLHEYMRANKLRRLMSKLLCMVADEVIVADETLRESIAAFTKQCSLRAIPSNIYDENALEKVVEREPKRFVFFGIVNPKTKAFDEMLAAWDGFNADDRYRLCIISSSKLDGIEAAHKGIEYVHNADDARIIETMKSSTFCLLPIKPAVDLRSATLKTACLAGCICIGKFDAQFQGLPFVYHTEYRPDVLQGTLEKAARSSDAERRAMSQKAEEWAQKYTPAAVAENIAAILKRSYETARS